MQPPIAQAPAPPVIVVEGIPLGHGDATEGAGIGLILRRGEVLPLPRSSGRGKTDRRRLTQGIRRDGSEAVQLAKGG